MIRRFGVLNRFTSDLADSVGRERLLTGSTDPKNEGYTETVPKESEHFFSLLRYYGLGAAIVSNAPCNRHTNARDAMFLRR